MATYLEVDGYALIQPIRLLLVDSEAEERARVRQGLGPRFEVTEAPSGAQAIELLGGGHYYDGILTSYLLEGAMNGVALLQYVFERRPDMYRILAHEKWVIELDELQLRERGVVSLFKAKPVDPGAIGRYFRDPWESP